MDVHQEFYFLLMATSTVGVFMEVRKLASGEVRMGIDIPFAS